MTTPSTVLTSEVEIVSSIPLPNSEKRLPRLGHDVFDSEQLGRARALPMRWNQRRAEHRGPPVLLRTHLEFARVDGLPPREHLQGVDLALGAYPTKQV